MTLHVMTILGTRPEIIRLSRVIPALDRHYRHTLVHTGQNHGPRLSQIFFDELGVRAPDLYLDVAADTAAEAIANIIARADGALVDHQPDAVLILGDTNSALAAIPARRRRVPIFHMEAGNRSFDPAVPEEVNRRIVDHLADINLPYTELARANLLREGIAPETIIVTGSPMREVLDAQSDAIAASPVLAELGLEPGAFFAVSGHRAETVDDPARLAALMALLAAVAERYGLPLIVSTHPRTARRLDGLALATPPLVRLLPPFGFPAWMRLQTSARAVLSDSGTLSEEAAILGFPAVALRDSDERSEAHPAGTPIYAGLDAGRALDALAMLAADPTPPAPPADYAPADVSQRIARILLTHTDRARRRTRW